MVFYWRILIRFFMYTHFNNKTMYLKRNIFFCGSLLFSSGIYAETQSSPPSMEKLWQLVQEQQKQLQQQQQQIQQQKSQIETLRSQVEMTPISSSENGVEELTLETVSVEEGVETLAPIGSADPTHALTQSNDTQVMMGGDDDYLQENKSGNFSYTGYMTANYHNFDWDTDPDRRATADLERLVLEGRYQLNDRFAIQAEIEFEHGGTGSTMEFERLEEFGEFEFEVEKGGEIILEELFLEYAISPQMGIKVGEIPVPVGLINKRHRPRHYYTVERSESESAMIPVAWHELGIELFGTKGPFAYKAQVISGLDSTGFSSANWIRGGFQTRFEQKNVDNLALAGRLDYHLMYGVQLGASAYFGNSTDNRPKADLEDDGYVTIFGLDGIYERAPWTVRGSLLWGHLSNSEAISAANRRLPNALGVARTPVAERATAWNMEVGYDLFSLFKSSQDLPGTHFDWFVRYDEYDTMSRVEGDIFKNPRYERTTWTTGFNYGLYKGVVLKGQYSHRKLGTDELNQEDTLSLGVGVEF